MTNGIYRRYKLSGELVEERIIGSGPNIDAATLKIRTKQWPTVLLPMKALAQPGDRGAGDIIARVIGPIGGDSFKKWYKTLFGKDCGCGHRQEVLNQRWPL